MPSTNIDKNNMYFKTPYGITGGVGNNTLTTLLEQVPDVKRIPSKVVCRAKSVDHYKSHYLAVELSFIIPLSEDYGWNGLVAEKDKDSVHTQKEVIISLKHSSNEGITALFQNKMIIVSPRIIGDSGLF